jgi:hypothetical protein
VFSVPALDHESEGDFAIPNPQVPNSDGTTFTKLDGSLATITNR